MKLFERIIGFCLAFCVFFSLIPTMASAADIMAGGTCGENLTWTLDKDGLLTVSGTGPMTPSFDIPWYNYRDSVSAVVIEAGTTTIGYHKFDGCEMLTSVVLPETVTQLGEYSFQNCGLLKTINFPKNLTVIDKGAFYNCISLRDVVLPDGLTVLDNAAFYNCDSITSIELPDCLTTIGNEVFGDCNGLKNLVIPSSVQSIGGYVFNNSTNLKNLVFLGDAPIFDDNTFYNYTATVYYPANNTTWTEDVRKSYNGQITWTSYEGNAPVFENENEEYVSSGICGEKLTWELDENGVLTISGVGPMYNYGWYSEAQSPWYGNQKVTELIVQEGVTTIGSYAFGGCNGLEEITLPDSLREINMSAFIRCVQLNSVEIPENVDILGDNVFEMCTLLKNVKLPSHMESIGSSAFANCKNLREIEIPEGITELWYTFGSCSNLWRVKLPTSLRIIGDQTFNCCKRLTTVEIPEGVLSIGYEAFNECTSLKELLLPSSVQEIGGIFAGTFAFCSSLESFAFPYGIHTISNNTLVGCENLQTVTIPASVAFIDRAAFTNCKNLTDVYFTGNEAQWKNIEIERGNEQLQAATIHFLETEEPIYYEVECRIQRTQGDYAANWSDRVILPAFAQDFYNWLLENTDADGEEDILVEAAASDNDPIIYYHKIKLPVMEAENRDALIIKLIREWYASQDAIATTYEVFKHDHPEIPLLNGAFGFGGEFEILDDYTGQITIDFDIYLGFFKDYYSVLEKQEDYLNKILEAVPENWNRYEQLRAFHNYLTLNNCYNTGSPKPESAHHAITALEGNRGENGPVCDGYAKAFQMLCNARNIPCEYVIGKALDDIHGWNVVQMEDRKWYAVDVTWDDPTVLGITSATSGHETEDYFLVGSNTQIGAYTFDESHIPWQYVSWATFLNYPVLSDNAYTPVDESDGIHTWKAADCTAPKTCVDCGITDGTPLGHSYKAITSKPECEKNGVTTYTCQYCNDSYVSDKTAAFGHDYVYVLLENPKIDETGKLTGWCSRCKERTEVILPARSSDDYTYTVTQEPTATEPGIGTYTWKDTTYGVISFDVEIPSCGLTLTGTITSYLDDTTEVIIELLNAEEEVVYTTTVTGNTAAYEITGVVSGTYTLWISKQNHVTRMDTITVEEDTELDVAIYPIGDVTCDGEVSGKDCASLLSHVKGIKLISDAYLHLCADVTGDGEISGKDCAALLSHVKGIKLLF